MSPRSSSTGAGPTAPISQPRAPEVQALRAALDTPEVRAHGGSPVEALRALLDAESDVRLDGDRLVTPGGRPLGRRMPYGSVVLDHPALEPRARLVELDPDGRPGAIIRRSEAGALLEAHVWLYDRQPLVVLPRGGEHPLWGASDRLVSAEPGGELALLSLCQAVAWDAVTAIPALSDPTRLPPGAGSALLNLIAGLARDQASGPLAYRGPYPTEQLFWALVESFRFEGGQDAPVARFTRDAEATFREGRRSDADDDTGSVPPVRWFPAPHERRLVGRGLMVHLRDGVETLTWEGRTYRRAEVQGLRRREHRVLRRVTGPAGTVSTVASLWALGRPLEDHFVLDEGGSVAAGPHARAEEPAEDVPAGARWREALGCLLPLEATPLLARAIAAVWSDFDLVWGPVPHDLVAVEGRTLRLARRLGRTYRTACESLEPSDRRALGRVLVRDVLGLVGDPVRRAAASWLAALSPDAQQAELATAAADSRRAAAARAIGPLDALLAALAGGEAVPSDPRR